MEKTSTLRSLFRGVRNLFRGRHAVLWVSVLALCLASPVTRAGTYQVTLLTGDVVTYTQSPQGEAVAAIDAAPRFDDQGQEDEVSFVTQSGPDGLHVYPEDALPYIISGRLDRRLFNIAGLVRQGLDDTRSRSLSLIVTHRRESAAALSANALARSVAALQGSRLTRTLTSVRGAALKVERSLENEPSARFWNSLRKSLRGNTIEKVWLDGKTRVVLNESVPLIGAPIAWAAGFDGTGVTVAVLDTGVDATHADLAGKIVAEKNFTEETDAGDGFGHGTHVASTVLGTGAASGGLYKGVAHGAKLMNGKVCDSSGFCDDSSVIAGMEWAARSSARVINLSLGGGATDGTDPLSQAVDNLTAETGALFVVAAGNAGPGVFTVSNPGAATAALTVGAVDKLDSLASFSSRGLRAGNFAVKPNLTAPGVRITAALAAGISFGTPVDANYTTVSGTSMATPHVAGAAAILAQANPDWKAADLKNALVSTTRDGGLKPHEQGAGRVDVVRALQQKVYATASVDFGQITAAATQPLTYVNTSSSAVTLSLGASAAKLDGTPASSGAVSLSASSVTVPAGGQASVSLSVDPAAAGDGIFGGVVTASAGTVRLRTPFGFGNIFQDTLTVRMLDSAGNPVDAFAVAINDTWELGEQKVYEVVTLSKGVGSAVVARGSYTVIAFAREVRDEKTFRFDLLTAVEVPVQGATTITLDARSAVLTTANVKGVRTSFVEQATSLTRGLAEGEFFSLSFISAVDPSIASPVYITPAPMGELAPLFLTDTWILAQPVITPAIPASRYNLSFLYQGIPESLEHIVTLDKLVRVPTHYHADKPDAMHRRAISVSGSLFGPISTHRTAGLRRGPFLAGTTNEYYGPANDKLRWLTSVVQSGRNDAGESVNFDMRAENVHRRSKAGTTRPPEHWFQPPLRVGALELTSDMFRPGEKVVTPPQCGFCRGTRDGTEFVPSRTVIDSTLGHFRPLDLAVYFGNAIAWRMFNHATGQELPVDKQKYRDINGTLPVFHLQAEETVYRLEGTLNTTTARQLGAGLYLTAPLTTSTWIFRSKAPAPETTCPAPYSYVLPEINGPTCAFQPVLQLRYDFGLSILNRAPAGRAHVFQIEARAHAAAPNSPAASNMSVQYSTNAGVQWKDAWVKPLGKGRFGVVIAHPPLSQTDGFVWLRTRASDTAGNSVDQTIQRAYILEGPTAPAPHFTLLAAPASLNRGGSGTSTISISSLNGFSSAVSLSVSGLPSGVTASFSPSSVTPSAAGGRASSTLTLRASSTATTGTFNVTITGIAGTLTRNTNLRLTVGRRSW